MADENRKLMYDNAPWTINTESPQKTLIKEHMEKISIGLILSFFIMSVVTAIITFIDAPVLLMQNHELYTLVLYVLNGIGLTLALPIGAATICKLLKIPFGETVSVKRSGAIKTLLVVLSGLGICMLSNFMVEIMAYITSFTGIDITAGTDMGSPAPTGINIAIMLLSTALVPALAEELMFRGVILGVLRKFGDSFAIVISSLLFGLLHGNLVQAPFAFVVGLILAYSVVYTGSVIPAMLIHFCNNAISVVFSALPTGMNENVFSAVYFLVSIALIIAGIISIFTLAKRDRSFSKLGQDENMENSFKTRVISALTEPWTIIFTVFMICSSIFLIVSDMFV